MQGHKVLLSREREREREGERRGGGGRGSLVSRERVTGNKYTCNEEY